MRFDGTAHRISNLGRYGTSIDGVTLAEMESRLLDYGSRIAIADAYILEYYPNLTLPGDVGDAVRGLLEINTTLQKVHVGGIDVTRSISPDRWKVLEILHERHGGIISRGDIRRHIVDPDEFPVYSDAAIDQSLTRLRSVLDPRGLGWRYITSHRGSGWSLIYRPATD